MGRRAKSTKIHLRRWGDGSNHIRNLNGWNTKRGATKTSLSKKVNKHHRMFKNTKFRLERDSLMRLLSDILEWAEQRDGRGDVDKAGIILETNWKLCLSKGTV